VTATLVSIVVPTFHEDGLAASLDALADHLRSIPQYQFEILVVDDSGAAHKSAIDSWIRERARDGVAARRIDGKRRGKGDAVRVGALAANGELVLTMDADLPVPLSHVEEFVELLDRGGYDLVVAERPMTRNTSEPIRYVLSRALFVAQWMVVFGERRFDDTQCGFKGFRAALLRELASRQVIRGGMYDIEYLSAAVRRGAKVARVPVEPNPEVRRSKIRVLRAIVDDPIAIARIKWRLVTRAYDR
jgi:dolichyl-phosphate beta-glucosyltransferase